MTKTNKSMLDFIGLDESIKIACHIVSSTVGKDSDSTFVSSLGLDHVLPRLKNYDTKSMQRKNNELCKQHGELRSI